MMDFIRIHQLNIMLVLSGICGIITFFVMISNAMPKRRKLAMAYMEASATLLLTFDRYAYIYRGDTSSTGLFMTKLSNFLVFLLTISCIRGFNQYLADLCVNEVGRKNTPKRLWVIEVLLTVGGILVIVSQFTGLYYHFDETNHYVRGPFFVISYIAPLVALILQLSVIVQYFNILHRGIRYSLLFFVCVSFSASILQAFTYGISLTNISMVGMAVLIYILALIDLNDTVKKANEIKISHLKGQQQSMQKLFRQTVKALAKGTDAKELGADGHSIRVAEVSKKLAEISGRNEKECEEAYYAGLLHDVGKMGVPDSVMRRDHKFTKEEEEIYRLHTVQGGEILSSIEEYPFLAEAAHYHHERYDGTGYPEGLKGEEIPYIARIVAVANCYDGLTGKRGEKGALASEIVREEFVKGTGTRFDPEYARIMVRLIDQVSEEQLKEESEKHTNANDLTEINEMYCGEYKGQLSEGIHITENITRISLKSEAEEGHDPKISIPTVILFDSLDGCVQIDEESISKLRYLEYGEIWFDGNVVTTAARNVKVDIKELSEEEPAGPMEYEIEAVRIKDHARITIKSSQKTVDVVMALQDSIKWAYISLTGENCHISDVVIHETEETVLEDSIPRIAEEVTYISGLEGDIPNIQVNGYRTDATDGIPISDGLMVSFHAMSLPTANLVWHCPYMAVYNSGNGKVTADDYREYALIRLDGENTAKGEYADSRMSVNREYFGGWDAWKEANKKGYDCTIYFRRRKNKITITTENAGVSIKNVTTVTDGHSDIYLALTGDQCAMTDIRISQA